MAIDPKYFVDTKGLKQGDDVSFVRKSDKLSGHGVITLIWLGIEECVEIDIKGGGQIHLFPALGDQVTVN